MKAILCLLGEPDALSARPQATDGRGLSDLPPIAAVIPYVFDEPAVPLQLAIQGRFEAAAEPGGGRRRLHLCVG